MARERCWYANRKCIEIEGLALGLRLLIIWPGRGMGGNNPFERHLLPLRDGFGLALALVWQSLSVQQAFVARMVCEWRQQPRGGDPA